MAVFCALLLGASAIAAWIITAPARLYVRRNLHYAAMLYTAQAASGLFAATALSDTAQLALIVGLLVSALAPALLAFAAYGALARPLISSWAAAALVATCVCAIAAALTGLAVLALVPQTIAVVALIVLGLRQPRGTAWRLCLSAISLFAGTLAIVADNADSAATFSLFSAAGLLGVARIMARASHSEDIETPVEG